MSQIRLNFNKAANSYKNHAFLQKEISIRLADKLNTIKIKPEIILDLGAGTGIFTEHILKKFPKSKIYAIDFAQNTLHANNAKFKICADANQIPLANKSVDLIASNLMMQWCNNLDIVFTECLRILKPGGLMFFSTLGPDTLKELKNSYLDADSISNVNTFIDMHDVGDQMLLSGFKNPIMEMEILTLTYKNVIDLMKDLKGTGAQTVKNRSNNLIGKNKFNKIIQMYENYRKDGKLPATYEVIYGHAWKEKDKLNKIDLDN